MTAGNIFREARQTLHLTLEETARRAGLSKGFLSQVENGKVGLGLNAAKRLAGVLRLSLDDLNLSSKTTVETPAWLSRLTSRHDLHPEAQAALLKVAEESAVYRSAAGGAAALKEWSEDERWEKFYQSVKDFLPKPLSDRLVNDPRVRAVAQRLGVNTTFAFTVKDLLAAVGRRVEALGEQIEKAAGLRALLLKHLGVEVLRLDADTNLDALKQRLARYGLLRAIGELAFFMEDETLMGASYPVRMEGAPYRFVCLVDRHTEQKKNRSDFTLWHELAHLLCDPEIGRGSVAVAPKENGGEGKEPFEWLMDKIAAHLAFYPPLFRPVAVQAAEASSGRLDLKVVQEVMERFNPDASRQMTTKALVDVWPEPVVYLEAELRSEKGAGTEKQVRVAHLHANEAARARDVGIGFNMRVPEDSVIRKCHDRMSQGGVIGWEDEIARPLQEADEDLGDWTFSDGRRLNPCPVRISAEARSEGGQIRVYAFMMPLPVTAGGVHGASLTGLTPLTKSDLVGQGRMM